MGKQQKNKKKTLFLRAPLVAIGAQKIIPLTMLVRLFTGTFASITSATSVSRDLGRSDFINTLPLVSPSIFVIKII